MSLTGQFLWVILPYLALSIFVLGHLYRYGFSQYTWTARSSEFLEKRHQRWASQLFHYGIIFVFLGHVLGLLVPAAWTGALGVSERLYQEQALLLGGVAGLLAVVGIVWFNWRRWSVARLRRNSSLGDYLAIALLLLVIALGIYNTLLYPLSHHGPYNYRATIAPWLRGFLTGRPDAALMVHVPATFQLHLLAAFLLFALWPFTRLVHLWSLPLAYLRRRYILYRGLPPEAR